MSWAKNFDGAILSALTWISARLALFAAKFGTGGFVERPDWIFDGTPAYFYLVFDTFVGVGSVPVGLNAFLMI